MRIQRLPLAVLALAAAALGCSSDNPSAPAETALDFQIDVPHQIQTKGVLDVETRITRANGIQYPLTVTYEKANVDEPFLKVGEVYINDASQSVTGVRVPILKDPQIRVTVSEASAAHLTVSKTVAVDVVDFP